MSLPLPTPPPPLIAEPRRLSARTLAFAEKDLEWYHAGRHASLGIGAAPPEPMAAASDPDQTGAKIVKMGAARHAIAVRRLYIVEPRLWALSAEERADLESLYCPPPVRRPDSSEEVVGVVGAGAPVLAHEWFRVPDTNVRAVGLAMRLLARGWNWAADDEPPVLLERTARDLLNEFRPRKDSFPRWVEVVRDGTLRRREALLLAYATVRAWAPEPPMVEASKARRALVVAARARELRDIDRRCHRCGSPGGEECGRGCPSAR